MKLLAFFLSSLAVFPTLIDQGVSASKWYERRKLYPELMSTFDLAESAPAPLRALALLRIASSTRLKDSDWKRELLEESFQAASQSLVPWPVNYVSAPEGPARLIPQKIHFATKFLSGLDRLSLETAAIRSMLPIDNQKARKLFDSLPPLASSPLTCSDGIVPNVEAYYQTASQVAKLGFFSSEKGKKEGTDFLREVMQSISSAFEVAPAAQLLLEQNRSSGELAAIVAIFAERLPDLAGDSRSFFDNLDSTSELVLKLSDSLGGEDALAFLQAWRTYLVRNLSGARWLGNGGP